jgi:hypothetical protein
VLILLAVSTAILQFGNYVLKAFDSKWLDVSVYVKPVTDVGICPVLDCVGDLLGGSKNGALSSSEIVVDQLLDGKAIGLRDATDVIAAVLDYLIIGRNLLE